MLKTNIKYIIILKYGILIGRVVLKTLRTSTKALSSINTFYIDYAQ